MNIMAAASSNHLGISLEFFGILLESYCDPVGIALKSRWGKFGITVEVLKLITTCCFSVMFLCAIQLVQLRNTV
mgnify:CR=1 FL=1